jgi:outer membrane protein TolC
MMKLASTLSEIRRRYWTFYESRQKLAISEEAMGHAQTVLLRERTRFSLGDAAVIDTLEASLELLKVQRIHIDNVSAAARARNDLATALMLAPDAVVCPESLDVEVGELPDPQSLIRQVRAYDPQRNIFELMQRKLGMAVERDKGELLPQIDLSASYRYDDQHDNSVVSLILSYSLPTKARQITKARTALEFRQVCLEREEYELELENKIGELIDNWNLERQKLSVAKTSSVIARLKLDAATEGNRLGTVDRLSYIKAQNDFLTEASAYLQQQIGLKRLEIMLDEITGNLFSRFAVELQ